MAEKASVAELTVFADVACTLCGCVCDDLQISVNDDEITQVKGACDLALPWFEKQSSSSRSQPQIEGRVAPLDECLDKAAGFLEKARFPLVFGMSESSTPGQRAACELADFSGAVIDAAASEKVGPSSLAVQRVGETTATLGEVKLRSDVIVFWGTDPATEMPRFIERFATGAVRDPQTGATRDRFVIVIDSSKTKTAERADLFIQIADGEDFELLWALRAIVNGIEIEDQAIGSVALNSIDILAKRLMSSQYGAIFYGTRLTGGAVPQLNVEALLGLAADLHQHTRCVVRKMRAFGSPSGAENVLGWQTGYPHAVSLNRRYPRHNPGEFSGSKLLIDQVPDLLIILGTHGLEELVETGISLLSDLPSVLLTYDDVEADFQPTVQIPVKTYGVHAQGTAYRMDDTPIRLRPFLETELPTDEEVLKSLTRKLQESCNDG